MCVCVCVCVCVLRSRIAQVSYKGKQLTLRIKEGHGVSLTCVRVYTCMCIYMCMYIHAHVYTCACIYMYVYIHVRVMSNRTRYKVTNMSFASEYFIYSSDMGELVVVRG